MDNSLPTPNINLDNQPDSITVVFSKKKLFISLIVFSLFSAIFGVLAYQAGINSRSNSIVEPTIQISNSVSPSSIPVSSYPSTSGSSCQSSSDCPKLDCVQWPCASYQCVNKKCIFATPAPTSFTTQITQSYNCPAVIAGPCTNDRLPNGCGYSAISIPQGCPGGCPVICSSSNNIHCISDNDCKVEILCENPSGFCCSRGQCINGTCVDHQSSPGKCD